MLNGEVSQDNEVIENQARVARLRGWLKHIQFGIVAYEDSSVCRITLGLGRGYTKWVSMWEMAQ